MRKNFRKPVALLVSILITTNPAYPALQEFKKAGSADEKYSLRAQSFVDRSSKAGNGQNGRSSIRSRGFTMPSAGTLPLTLPADVRKLAEMLAPLYGPDQAQRLAKDIIEKKGIEVPRRGIGRLVGVGTIDLEANGHGRVDASLSLNNANGSNVLPQEAARTSELMLAGLEWLLDSQDIAPVREALSRCAQVQQTIPVELCADHDRLMNLAPLSMLEEDELRSVVFDTDVPATLDMPQNRNGLTLLFAMGLMHQMLLISGVTQEEALLRVLDFYEQLEEQQCVELLTVLKQKEIDNADNFATFLEKGAGADDLTKQTQISLLLKLERAELPYAQRRIAAQVYDDQGRLRLDDLGLTQLREVTHAGVSESYSPQLEAYIAQRVADEAQENGVRLVMGFLGRAGLIEQLLMAAAEVVPADQLRAPFGALCKAFGEKKFEGLEVLDSKTLQEKWGLIEAKFIAVSNLLSTPTVSLPRFKEAMRGLQAAMDDFIRDARTQAEGLREKHAAVIAKELDASRAQGGTAVSPTLNKIQSDVAKVTAVVDDFAGEVFVQLSIPAQNLPKFHRVWNIALQRLVDRETLNLFLLNQLQSPYLDRSPDFTQMLNEGGKFLHVAADIRPYLRRVSDWIQALPAYAWYKMVDMPGGGYEIMSGCERDILEFAFKGYTDDIAVNIESVMREEHTSLARTILAERLGPAFQAEVDRIVALRKSMQLGEDKDTSREEAIRNLLERDHHEEAVAALAAVIDATYHNLEREVGQFVVQHGVQRIVALRVILRLNESDKNLVTQVLDTDGSTIFDQANAIIAQRGLGQTLELMRPCAMLRRRDQPTVHNLTTLGPGETTTYLTTWLETSLSLFLFCRENNLNERVDARMKEYRLRTAHAAWRVVQSFDLEGQLFESMVSRGLDPTNTDQVLSAVGEMMARYPEVSLEVARICAIMEHEERTANRPKDAAHFSQEPDSVTKYIDEHRQELDEQATVYIVQQYNLNAAVKAYQNEHRKTWQESARAVIQTEPDADLRDEYQAEHKAYVYHLARKEVVTALNLQPNVAGYNRLHSGPLALYTARQEITAEFIAANGGDWSVLDDPKYRYESSGPYKKCNIGYTPSRVDLGEGERASVEYTGKVVTADDQEALNRISDLHRLYNMGVVAFPATAMGEFFKARENFFTRGGVFYLSLGEGINIDAIQIGDQEEYMYFSNRRGDRTVLPTGESYRGFCVPKEFFLIYAVMSASAFRNAPDMATAAFRRENATNILMNFAPVGRAGEFRKMIEDSFEKGLAPGTFLGDLRTSLNIDAADMEQWREKANQFFEGRYEHYYSVLGTNTFLGRLPVLAKAMETWGITMSEEEQETREVLFSLAQWANRKMQGLEQINRIGPYRRLEHVHELVEECIQRCERLGRPVKSSRDLIYMVGGPYKAGSRKGGEDKPITDARFSSALDKLLAISGMDEHLDEYFDPEARAIINRIRSRIVVPADVRIAGTVGASDIMNATPGIPVARYIDEVKEVLAQFGITDAKAYCTDYGAALWRWPMPAAVAQDANLKRRWEALQQNTQFTRKLHLLVTEERDVIKSYHQAVQGADIIDLAIGDPELLDLIDNLPEFVARMRLANPQGLLVFSDGQVGARPRAFAVRNVTAEYKAKELFALDDTAVYGSLGLGRDTVNRWRLEMETERSQAEELFKALCEAGATSSPELQAEAYARARTIYERMSRDCVFYNKAEHVSDLLQRGISETGKANPFLRCMAVSLANVKAGLPLDRLDFATWLALGGRFLLNGRLTEANFEEVRHNFETAVAGMTGKTPDADIPGNLIAVNVAAAQKILVKPVYQEQKIEEFSEKSSGIVTVGKVGEARAVKLAGRAIRRQKKQEQLMFNERRSAFRSLCTEQNALPQDNQADFSTGYQNAKDAAGAPDTVITQEKFSRLIYWTEVSCLRVLDRVIPAGSESARLREKQAIAGRIRQYFQNCVIDSNQHRRVVKDMSRLIELASQALSDNGVTPETAAPADMAVFNDIARAGELLDMTLLVSLEYDVDLTDPKLEERAAIKALFNFYDKTMNAHTFDYYPFLTQPSLSDSAFDRWFTHEQKFDFSSEHHGWLYCRARRLMVERTSLKHKDAAYQRQWLGDVSDWQHPETWQMGLGVNVEGAGRQFWFSYAKLRDAAAMIHEFEPLNYPSNLNGVPEVFWDVDPSILDAGEEGKFTNVISMYPHGNTTMPVAIEQGVAFEEQGVNLMLCPFPVRTYDAVYGCEVLQVRDAVMYVSAARYEKLLRASGVAAAQAQEMASRVPKEGILVAIKFREPVRSEKEPGRPAFGNSAIAHGAFFHFTHEMRPDVETVGVPVVQPLCYEAFTYLKGAVPDVLRGTTVAYPAGFIWNMEDTVRAQNQLRARAAQPLATTEVESGVKAMIRDKLIAFLKQYPQVTEVIEKPEKESGGRGAELLPIVSRRARRTGALQFVGSSRKIDEDMADTGMKDVPEGMRNLERMVDAIYEVSLTDRVIVQGVIPSVVRTLFTHQFLEEVQADRAAKGTAVSIDTEPRTPLFSYFRYILSRGQGNQFQTASSIVVIPTEGIGNVARGSTLRVYDDSIVNPEFREPLRRALDNAYYGSMAARQQYIRHAWPHVLREYLVLNKRFGEPVAARLNEHLTAHASEIVSGFIGIDTQYQAAGPALTQFFAGWSENFMGLDNEGRDFSTALESTFPELAQSFKQFLGSALESAGLLNLEINYSMDDAMPLYLGDEGDGKGNYNYLAVVERDNDGNLPVDQEGNVKVMPLVGADGKATDVRLYDKDGNEVPTRDALGNPIAVAIFEEHGGQRTERELYDRNVLQMDETQRAKFKVSCIQGVIIEFNPGAGLWRPYDMALRMLDPKRAGEGARAIFMPLAERADAHHQTLNPQTALMPHAADVVPVYNGAGADLYMSRPEAEAGTYESFADIAAEKAREDLGGDERSRFGVDDASVVLTYMAVEQVRHAHFEDDWDKMQAADPDQLLVYIRESLANPEFQSAARTRMDWQDVNALNELFTNQAHMGIIEDMALECALQGEEAVAISVALNPVNPVQVSELFGNRKVCGLVYNGMSTLFTDTVSAFQIDSDSYFDSPGKGIAFLGVHKGWLTEDGRAARRALIAYSDGSVKLVTFTAPVLLQEAGILHLGRETERATHAELSNLFEQAHIPVFNPYHQAEVMDSKSLTASVCGSNALIAQPFQRPSKPAIQTTPESKKYQLASYAWEMLRSRDMLTKGRKVVHIVIKPDHGTESEMTESFVITVDVKGEQSSDVSVVEDNELARALAHMEAIGDKGDDCLISEVRGNITDENGNRAAFRINACETPGGHEASTGMAWVGADSSQVVLSKEKGAVSRDINEALWNLKWQGKPLRDRIDLNAVAHRMQETACEVARTLSARGIIGVDMVLEVITDASGNLGIVPVFLEANPRPALLSAARRIDDFSGGRSPDSLPQAANPSFYQALHNNAVDIDRFMRAEYTINEWLDIIRNPAASGFDAFLVRRYGEDPAKVAQKRQEYEKAVTEASESGLFDPAKPAVVIAASPGRVRVEGGHPDAKGIMVKAVNMATEEEILMVVQRSDDREVIAQSAGRGRKQFSMDAPEVNPGRKLKNQQEWVNWAREKKTAGQLKITSREDDWELFPKAAVAYYQAKYYGDIPFSGCRIYMARTDLPVGGVSSSSAVVMGINFALDRIYGLFQTRPELAQNGNVMEYEYTNVWAGAADQYTIALGKRGQILIIGNSPETVLGSVSFPNTVSAVFSDSGISRSSMDLRAVSEKFLGEFGKADIGGDSSKTLGDMVNKRSGSSAALAALWIRHKLPELIASGEFTPEEKAQLERMNEDMTYYERVVLKLSPDRVTGFLREFLSDGRCGLSESTIFKVLKCLPVQMTHKDLLSEMPEFAANVENILGKIGTIPEPAAGYKLRDGAVYGLSEGERVSKFCEACQSNDVDTIMEVHRRGHDGDRVAQWDIRIDNQGHITASPQPAPFRGTLTDNELDQLRDGQSISKNGKQVSRLWQCAGTFERSLEPIDYLCDLVDAWSRKTGIKAAARISAAGLGGNVSIFCEKEHIPELVEFLKVNYYGGYLKTLLDGANGTYGTKMGFEFVDGKTARVFNPGEGTAVTAGNFMIVSSPLEELAPAEAEAIAASI